MKKKDFFKKFFVKLIFIASIPFSANAFDGISFEKNILKASGSCDSNIVLQLFADESLEKSIYSAGVVCKDEKYYFSDDLSKWNVPEGEYAIVIDGEKTNVQSIEIKYEKQLLSNATVNQTNKQEEKKNKQSEVKQKEKSADVKFLEAFASFQQSILDMHSWLSKTEYPSWIKEGIDFTLNGIDELVVKISETLFSADSSQNETSDIEQETNDTEQETGDVGQEMENVQQEKGDTGQNVGNMGQNADETQQADNEQIQ